MISQELLQGFIAEASDLLDDMEPALVSYPRIHDIAERSEIVNRVFRHFHSIKGSAGFVGLHDIARLTHEAETLLDQYQNNPENPIPNEVITLLCRTVDFLRILFEEKTVSSTRSGKKEIKETSDEDKEALEILIKEISASTKHSRPSSHTRQRHDTTIQIQFNSDDTERAEKPRRKSNTRVVDKNFNALEKQPKDKAPAAPTPPARKTSTRTTKAKEEAISSASTTTSSSVTKTRDKSDTVRIIRAGASQESIDKITKSDFLERYVSEANELLEQTEQALLQAEQHPEYGNETVQEALRCLHSFKGNSGFMNLKDLERLSHRMETEIESTTGKAMGLDAHTFDVLLQMIDVLRQGVLDLSCGGTGEIPEADLYIAMMDDVKSTSSTSTYRFRNPTKTQTSLIANPQGKKEDEQPVDDTPSTVDLSSDTEEEEPLKPIGRESVQENLGQVKRSTRISISNYPEATSSSPEGKDTVSASTYARPPAGPPPAPAPVAEKKAKKTDDDPQKHEKKTSGQRMAVTPRNDIRVDLNKLDLMLDLVGELVIAETMVTRHPVVVQQDNESLERAVHQLRRVATSLQDMAMSVRMIPLASTFRRMIRLVYDLSMKAGKLVDIVLLGEETEVDRTVIERISDPLVHIIRNAIDHGIESPDDRRALGKPETGRVTIEGIHEGGEVWIIITDDGRGLNRDAILRKARERGLIQDSGEELTDNQIYHFIFEPGFSTAAKVTDISGRGFGMDVVKKNIEKLSGRIDIRTREGEGTAVIMRIPLTLAIIDGMLVKAGDTRYIIPLLAIRESLKPDLEQIMHTPDGQAIIKLRDNLIPVVRLDEVFKRIKTNKNLEDGILMVVEGEDGGMVALFADELLGQQETVIKGLSGWLKKSRGVSGCTILGDGEVGLILDIGAIVKLAGKRGDI